MDGELAGFAIPRLGMGTMALAIEGRPDRDTAIRTIHAGLDAGVRYLDTAWSYYLPSEPGTGTAEDLGYGEKLVRDALTSWNGPRDEVLVATKTGYRRTMEVPAFVAPVSDSGESDKQGAGFGVQMSDSLGRRAKPVLAVASRSGTYDGALRRIGARFRLLVAARRIPRYVRSERVRSVPHGCRATWLLLPACGAGVGIDPLRTSVHHSQRSQSAGNQRFLRCNATSAHSRRACDASLLIIVSFFGRFPVLARCDRKMFTVKDIIET